MEIFEAIGGVLASFFENDRVDAKCTTSEECAVLTIFGWKDLGSDFFHDIALVKNALVYSICSAISDREYTNSYTSSMPYSIIISLTNTKKETVSSRHRTNDRKVDLYAINF